MIGSFLYSRRPREDDVSIWLVAGSDGSHSARIILPAQLAAMVEAGGYPPPAPTMAVEAALCYGLFLAIRSGVTLVISGDRGAWNPDWGYLTDLGQFPTAGLMPPATASDARNKAS